MHGDVSLTSATEHDAGAWHIEGTAGGETAVRSNQAPLAGDVRLTHADWQQLRGHVLNGAVEHAALLVCGVRQVPGRVTFLVKRVVELHDEDYLRRGELHLSIAPRSIAWHAKQARREGATLVLCHSHPFAGRVTASPLDLRTEAELCGRALLSRLGLPAGALVIGPDGLDGRVWTTAGASPLTKVRVIGSHVSVVDATSHGLVGAGAAAVPSRYQVTGQGAGRDGGGDAVARQTLLWGEDGQAMLGSAHVVVVGCGGTGSHIITQLAHLRVGRMTMIDPDVVEPSNLSRLLGATPADVGRAKVEVLSAAARAINPAVEVVPITASVLDVNPMLYTGADVIVCATDGHGSRALLIELTAQYLVPLIDLGVEVDPADEVFRAGGGVRVVRPGGGCLLCAQTLSSELIREEYLDRDQREREIKLGYIRGVAVPAPSVVALNGVVASLAVLEVCQLLVGMLGSGRSRLLYRAESRALTAAGLPSQESCHVCGRDGLLGVGDARALPTRWHNDAGRLR